jgi:hypothetical protein
MQANQASFLILNKCLIVLYSSLIPCVVLEENWMHFFIKKVYESISYLIL